MKGLFLVTLLVLALTLLITGVAWAQGGEGEAGGTPAQTPEEGEPAGDVAKLLLPIVTAATAIERFAEAVFDWVEGIIRKAKRWVSGKGKGYLGWARDQVKLLRKAVEMAGPTGLDEAVSKLKEAEERVEEYLKSPLWKSQKRTWTTLLSIGLGLVVALTTKLGIFDHLGITIPEKVQWVDWLITGLVIGTGSGPVHSLIGILQGAKDWLGKAGIGGKTVQQVVEELKGEVVAELKGTVGGLSQKDLEDLIKKTMEEVRRGGP